MLPLASFLVGCPQGAGRGSSPQDGGDADAEVTDADAADVEGGPSPEVADGGDAATTELRDALCGVNGQNACGPFAICDAKLGCVECARDSDCPLAAGRCLQGSCVACRPGHARDGGTSDCPQAGTACWSVDDQCHAACGPAVACPTGFLCDDPSGECVGCRADAECPSGVCSKTRRRCVECESDVACPALQPRCHVAAGRCVKCASNADCGHAAPICDPTTLACRVGCWSNDQCPGRACDQALGQCVDAPDAGAINPDAGL